MPYPYPIDPTVVSATVKQEYCPTNIFQNGTNLYWVSLKFWSGVLDPANVEPIQVRKSTDLGATWTVMDAAGAPNAIVTDRPFGSYGAQQSTTLAKLVTGSTTRILIPYAKRIDGPPAYGEMCFVVFDMSTDTYEAPVEGGPTVLGIDASDEYNRKIIGVYRPETDDYLFVYQGVRGATLPSPASYKPMYAYAVVYDVGTTTWGTPWNVAGPESGVYGDQNWFVRDLVYVNLTPTTNRVHLFLEFWAIDGASTGFAEIWHRVIRNDDSMSALALAATGLGFYTQHPITGMAILTSDGYLAMPFTRSGSPIGANQPWPVAIVFGAEAEAPTFTEYDVTAVPAEQLTSGPTASGNWSIMEWATGTIRAVWPNSQETGHPVQYADFDIGTLTWGAVGVAYNHPTANYGDFLASTKVGLGTFMVSTDRDALPNNNYAMSFWELFVPPSPIIIGGVTFGGPVVLTGGGVAGLPIVGGPPIGGPVVLAGGVVIGGLGIVGGPPIGGPAVLTGGVVNGGLSIVGGPPIGGPVVFTGGTVAGPVVNAGRTGSGVCPKWFRVPNVYDCCLFKFADFVRYYRPQDKRCCPVDNSHPNGLVMPEGAVEFWETGSLTTPTPGEVTLHQFTVPTGHRGMLYGLVLWYTGTGLVPGSGDIVWRVKVGAAWARNLGNCLFPLGIPGGSLFITDYIPLESQQAVRVSVDVPNGSGSIQVGTSRVLATLQGWYYPA